jgi:hypothetical protein
VLAGKFRLNWYVPGSADEIPFRDASQPAGSENMPDISPFHLWNDWSAEFEKNPPPVSGSSAAL